MPSSSRTFFLQLHFIDAEREGLDDEDIGEFIDDKAGQEIRFAENDAAGGGIDCALAVCPGVAHAHLEERVVNLL